VEHLEETPSEMFHRVSQESEARNIHRAKSAAKAAIMKKKVKTLTACFGSKWTRAVTFGTT
jgi:hypothetical protein